MSVFINHGVYLLFSFKYDFDNDGYGRTRWSQHVLCSSCLWSWSLCPADAVLCMWCRCSLWSCASYSRWLGAILHPWLALPPVSCRMGTPCSALHHRRCSTGRCVVPACMERFGATLGREGLNNAVTLGAVGCHGMEVLRGGVALSAKGWTLSTG